MMAEVDGDPMKLHKRKLLFQRRGVCCRGATLRLIQHRVIRISLVKSYQFVPIP